jgi:hypothetical protein
MTLHFSMQPRQHLRRKAKVGTLSPCTMHMAVRMLRSCLSQLYERIVACMCCALPRCDCCQCLGVLPLQILPAACAKAEGTSTGSARDSAGTVICGAGIIGAATAYYMAKQGRKCLVIDSAGVAKGTTAAAGAGLARMLFDGTPLEQLTHVSFEEHQKLANELTDVEYQCAAMLYQLYPIQL